MKPDVLRSLAVATLAWCCAPSAMAERIFNQCNIQPESEPNTRSMTYTIDMGDYFVPRDAPIGTPIGSLFQGFKNAYNAEGLRVSCNRTNPNNDPYPTLYGNIRAIAPIYPGTVPNIAGRDVTGKILQTNVKGVGVVWEAVDPWSGLDGRTNQFTPTTNSSMVPFIATHDGQDIGGGIHLDLLGARTVLVKIGEIDPGVQRFYGPMFEGDFTGVPNGFTASLTGTIHHAECSLDMASPVNPSPVPLGTWSSNDFGGPGTGTNPVPFQISLLNCNDDPGGSVATANIRLDGALGSTVIDKDLGLFSLDTQSTATGVGIQMLQSDGSVVRLLEDVPVARIVPSGGMMLNLAARFYQLPGSPYVTGGTATGALNFTISYQ